MHLSEVDPIVAPGAVPFKGGRRYLLAMRTRLSLAVSTAIVAIMVGLGATVAAAQPTRTAPAALPQLDSAQLIRDMFVIAADSMEGRRAGTPGGARARTYLLARLKSIGVTPLRDSFPMAFSAEGRGGAKIEGTNLIGVIRGTRSPDRYIVLSAHYDHVGIRTEQIYPGADDNASGTTAVLAIAAWLKANPPDNSVIVALFDAEESGLVGARRFLDAPPVPIEKIIANVNLDMVGRNDAGELYAAGGWPNPVMRPLIAATAAVAPVTLKAGHDSGSTRDNWTSQSDHGAFHSKGIPWVYFGVEDHPDYHRPTDLPNRIQPGFFFRSATTIADFVRRLDAAGDEVARVPHVPHDPHVPR